LKTFSHPQKGRLSLKNSFMLIFNDTKFIKSPFDNEAELEKVIIQNYEYLFGPNSFYLPKAKIKTADGGGTIPDGFAIDIAQRQWFLVEAELIHHSVWNHIAPQITKQILASQQAITRRTIVDLAVEQYKRDPSIKEKFDELNIAEINVRQVVGDILETEPVIGVPIDGVTNDLKDWARTLKYKVKLWLVTKFVEFKNPQNIIFEFPEEFKPALDTAQEGEEKSTDSEISRYDVDIADLVSANLLKVGDKLLMPYKPRNGQQKQYEATILENGSLSVLGRVYGSPSYAALAGINDSGSTRQTVNGWTSWKTSDGQLLSQLREKFLQLEDAN
jgi:RAMA domain-containing protein